MSRRASFTARRAMVFAAVLGALLPSCAPPTFGDLPARCSEGACPEGYDCIHGVCAKPGTAVPITVAELPYLRGSDLRVLPQTSTALVAWQTYAYSAEGQGFVAVRIAESGAVSPQMVFANDFQADEGANEPVFDLLRLSDEKLLLAIAAAPLPGDGSTEPRLVTYLVNPPAEGSEAEAPTFAAAWPEEKRMPSVGYGAVSRPELVHHGDHVELGYVQSRTTTGDQGPAATVGELQVFALDEDGKEQTSRAPIAARDGLTVAVGVHAAFSVEGGVWWVLDDARPNALFVPDATDEKKPRAQGKLGTLGLGVAADAQSLTWLAPSKRAGADKLPDDPVEAEATLHRLEAKAGEGEVVDTNDVLVGALPTVRDTPRPVWIQREGAKAILVTPGADIDAPAIGVHLVDPKTGASTPAAPIPRLSSLPLSALGATLVNGRLFVAWAEQSASSVTIRAAVVEEP